MTHSQQLALRWLVNRGGTGVFDRNGVLLAQGQLAGVMRMSWNALRDEGYVVIEKRRATVTEAGTAWCKANYSKEESETVDEELDG